MKNKIKQDPAIYNVQETHFRFKIYKGLNRQNGKIYSKQVETKRDQEITVFISFKIDSKPVTIKRDKEGHNIR